MGMWTPPFNRAGLGGGCGHDYSIEQDWVGDVATIIQQSRAGWGMWPPSFNKNGDEWGVWPPSINKKEPSTVKLQCSTQSRHVVCSDDGITTHLQVPFFANPFALQKSSVPLSLSAHTSLHSEMFFFHPPCNCPNARHPDP